MDMNNFRPEHHIAQQSRRDKLRVPQELSPPHQHLGVYNANNLDQIYESSALRNCRTLNVCYDSSEFCSDMIHPTSFNASSTVTTDPQYYTSCEANQGSVFVGEGSSKIVNTNPVSSSDAKSYMGYHQDLHSSSGYEYVNSNSSLYHNALMQQLVTSSNARSFGLEFASLQEKGSAEGGGGSWVGGGNELVLLPAYADQWGGGETEPCFVAPKDGDRDARVVRNDHSSTQALSLSLSCKAQENQIGEKDFQTVGVDCGNPNMSSGSRVLRQQPSTHRNPGPLGPFTGYTAILRSSKFLRPAQVLLEELCCIARPKDVEISDVPDKIFDEVRVSRDVVGSNAGPAMKGVAGNSGGSLFLINGSSDKGRDSPSLSFHQPENLQKKAKLLYMQDEVCKRYKQYHQQMQMVVSSFESVAGLTAATPFVSLALKMISKHFRSLKNAITDQLKGLKNTLGEESSPVCCKGDASTNVSMLKLFDQNYDHKDKGSRILESQHVWRPQRGLPERAVSILRAWLFDHFLHPYPTDTDKHMLATQTGLTRNQVSNWFINARVRVWKPMVEEIHMLETKGVSTEVASDANDGKNIVTDKQVGCSRGGSTEEGRRANTGVWSQEKRSRNEYHVPDGAFVGGIGSVSLTLGLRQGAENGARPVMQQERLLRPYGGQVIRDFVG